MLSEFLFHCKIGIYDSSKDSRTGSLGRSDALLCGAVGVFEPIESSIAINAAERTDSDCAEKKKHIVDVFQSCAAPFYMRLVLQTEVATNVVRARVTEKK